MRGLEERSDCELLVAAVRDPESFGVFYRRHVRVLSGFFWRKVADPEIVADLTAETFACALKGAKSFDPARGTATAWLYGIAYRNLKNYWDRGRVESRGRRRLWMSRLALDDEALERVEAVASAAAVSARAISFLDELPAAQRDAVRARVIDEQPYAQIALSQNASEQAIRQRVARGLAYLRNRMGGTR